MDRLHGEQDQAGEGALRYEDIWDTVMRGVEAQALRFPRKGFYVAASILAWVVLWAVVERHQHLPHTQTLAWSCVIAAVWVASTF